MFSSSNLMMASGHTLVAFALTTTYIWAADPANPVREPSNSKHLDNLLAEEATGASVDRRQHISESMLSSLPPAQAWQAGMVRIEDSWEPIETLRTDSLRLDSYRAKREELWGKPQAHLKMARWCMRNDYPQQARAHYFAVLAISPNNLEARKYLDHVLMDGAWYEQSKVLEARREALEIVKSLEIWLPKVKQAIEDVRSTNSRASLRGLEAFEDISSADAIPAIEFVASLSDPEIVNLCIAKLATFRSKPACLALTRLALAMEPSTARDAAITKISNYPEEFYVPDLLDTMSSDVEVRSQLVVRPNGQLALSALVGKELRTKKLLKKVSSFVRVISTFRSSSKVGASSKVNFKDSQYYSNYHSIPLTDLPDKSVTLSSSKNAQPSTASTVYVPPEVAMAAAENLRTQGLQQQRVAAEYNRNLKYYNQRVCGLLRRLTKEELPNAPAAWWAWWSDRYERIESEKPLVAVGYSTRDTIAMHTSVSSDYEGEINKTVTGQLYQWSCLIPGTMIQTAGGLVPIEKIHIGDLVASQDIETGEVAFQPVIMTTRRPPKPTFKIATDNDSISATGGHLWWVSGEGWMRTNELEPGMQIHTAKGTDEILGLSDNPRPAITHNLVVDQFHTYFVGTGRLLSYDNTLVKPTLKVVPGY